MWFFPSWHHILQPEHPIETQNFIFHALGNESPGLIITMTLFYKWRNKDSEKRLGWGHKAIGKGDQLPKMPPSPSHAQVRWVSQEWRNPQSSLCVSMQRGPEGFSASGACDESGRGWRKLTNFSGETSPSPSTREGGWAGEPYKGHSGSCLAQNSSRGLYSHPNCVFGKY